MKIIASDICTAFQTHPIGSQVTNYNGFMNALEQAIWREQEDGTLQGQMVLKLPPYANAFVRCGVGKIVPGLMRSDFTVRLHRENWGLYLNPRHAAATEKVDVVVYTREAYLNDPDILPHPDDTETRRLTKEIERTRVKDSDFVVVAVLAVAGPAAQGKTPYGARVLVHNIAGGNNDFLPAEERLARGLDLRKFVNDDYTGPHREALYDCGLLYWIIEQAKATESYHSEWMTVAEP